MQGGAKVYLAVLAGAVGAYLFLPTATQSVVFDAIGLSAAVAILIGGVWKRREPQLAWFLIGLGVLLMSVGDIVFGESSRVPSVADMFYISAYPLLALGFMALTPWWATKRREPSIPLAITITFVVGVLAWAFLILPTGLLHKTEIVARVIAWGYPVLDVVLVALLIRAALPERFADPGLKILFAAVLLWLMADITYAMADLGNSYQLGTWNNLLWLVAYAGFGASSLVPSHVADEQEDDPFADESGGGVGVLTRVEAPAIRLGVIVSLSGRMLLAVGACAIGLGATWSAVNLVLLGGALGMSGSFMWMAGSRA